jgi:hypothetical protein
MAFEAVLKLGGDKKLIECHYSLQRQTDFKGRPAEDVRGGSISFSLESTKDGTFAEWMVEPYTTKSGSIEFKDPASGAILKTVKFDDAYMVSYSESFHAADNQPMVESVVISAKKLTIGNAQHENEWPES